MYTRHALQLCVCSSTRTCSSSLSSYSASDEGDVSARLSLACFPEAEDDEEEATAALMSGGERA